MKPGNPVAIALCTAVAVLEGFDIQAMGVAALTSAAQKSFDKSHGKR